MASKNFFDFKSQLAFYGEYHNNPINQLIHIVFVPTIVWTVLVWTSLLGEVLPHPAFLPAWLELHPGWIIATIAYGIYFIILEPMAGLVAALFYQCVWASACYFVSWQVSTGANNHIAIASVLHIISWTFQFLGHGVAEKRKPTLLDNVGQAFLLAPFFVVIEVLFKLGYRPALAKEFQLEVDSRISAWKASKKQD